jgi:hypothetical protein
MIVPTPMRNCLNGDKIHTIHENPPRQRQQHFDSSVKEQSRIKAFALRGPFADCGANVKWPMIS